MAIAFDATSSAQNNDGTASLTFSHTCTSASILIVTTCTNQPQNSVTGVTYNGVAMTSVRGSLNAGSTVIDMWYLLAPSSGANNVVVTMAASSTAKAAQAVSYSGVDTAGFPDATSALSPLTTNTTQTITTVADNCWIVWGVYGGGAITAVTNCVVRAQESTFFGCGVLDTNSAQTPAGLKTMILSAGGASGGIMASFAPSTTSIKTIDGLAKASVKIVDNLAIASVKSWNGLE